MSTVNTKIKQHASTPTAQRLQFILDSRVLTDYKRKMEDSYAQVDVGTCPKLSFHAIPTKCAHHLDTCLPINREQNL